MSHPSLQRRQFLRTIALTVSGAVLAACGAPAAQLPAGTAAPAGSASAPTAESPAAQLVTPQGRTLPADAAPLDKQVLYESAAEPKHLDAVRDIYNAGVALNWGSEPL